MESVEMSITLENLRNELRKEIVNEILEELKSIENDVLRIQDLSEQTDDLGSVNDLSYKIIEKMNKLFKKIE